MSDLTDFLLARIAEDDTKAQAAVASQFVDEGRWIAREHYVISETKEDVTGQDAAMTPDVAAHIARWDPARVLAECEAKREAIECAWDDHLRIEGEWGDNRSRTELSQINDNPLVVVVLAAVYADHPDYRPEWKP